MEIAGRPGISISAVGCLVPALAVIAFDAAVVDARSGISFRVGFASCAGADAAETPATAPDVSIDDGLSPPTCALGAVEVRWVKIACRSSIAFKAASRTMATICQRVLRYEQ